MPVQLTHKLGDDFYFIKSICRLMSVIKRFDEKTEHGAFYEALNGEKKNVVLDLKNPQHRDVVLKLARSYDVLVEGNRPGVMDRLGLGYKELQRENPRLIYCSLSGYGATGPLAQ